MPEKFAEIGKIALWEADDHYVIQTINTGSTNVVEFRMKLTSAKVKLLCLFFGIPYDPRWTVAFFSSKCNGHQLTIHKIPVK